MHPNDRSMSKTVIDDNLNVGFVPPPTDRLGNGRYIKRTMPAWSPSRGFGNVSSSNRMYEVILHFTKIPSIINSGYGKVNSLPASYS